MSFHIKALGTNGGVDAPLTPFEKTVTLLAKSAGMTERVVPGTSRCEAVAFRGKPI